MSLTEDQITAQNFKDFFNIIKPYLNNTTNMGFTPVGTIIAVMGKTAPNNYLSCEGQIVNISDYPELANYFTRQFEQVNYFGGDGVSTFGIPDLRGEFLRGIGTNSHTNQGNGADVGVHQDATEHPYLSGGTNLFISRDLRYTSDYNQDVSVGSQRAAVASVAQSTVNFPSYFTSRPTNTSVLYCIATKNIYVDAKYDYSFNEKVIGTWTDGKPLYQLTMDLGELGNKQDTYYPITNSTTMEVVSLFGTTTEISTGQTRPLPFTHDINSDTQIALEFTRDKGLNVYYRNRDMRGWKAYVTLQYTKTTD